MLKRFVQKIEEMKGLIDRSAPRFLLAVSGGMDSMCMADLFLQSFGASSFAIAHCNFSLRGDESDGDEALVRDWAEKNGVEIFVRRFDTVGYARERGVSVEMAARDLRYGWFAQLCRDNGFSVLSVAHNANDNAETLLLNLLRGTGLKGLRGMVTISGTSHMMIFRPLLECTRKQIEGYVFSHKVPYRHDSSNFESDYKRNRIRNEVFPIFEKINPSFIRTISREMGYFSEAGEIVEDWCRRHIDEVVSVCGNTTVINTSALLATPHWRYLLYYILEPYGFRFQVLSSLEDLLISDRTVSGKRFESPTHVLITGRGCLKVMPAEISLDAGLAQDDGIMVVRGAGTYCFNGTRFKVEILKCEADMSLKQPSGTIIVDADKLRFPFVCRRWRRGDWFVPFGMKGKKKVSDLFTDLKYDASAKDSAIIMVDTRSEELAEKQHVAGVLGVRIDDGYKVTSSTSTIVRIIL